MGYLQAPASREGDAVRLLQQGRLRHLLSRRWKRWRSHRGNTAPTSIESVVDLRDPNTSVSHGPFVHASCWIRLLGSSWNTWLVDFTKVGFRNEAHEVSKEHTRGWTLRPNQEVSSCTMKGVGSRWPPILATTTSCQHFAARSSWYPSLWPYPKKAQLVYGPTFDTGSQTVRL